MIFWGNRHPTSLPLPKYTHLWPNHFSRITTMKHLLVHIDMHVQTLLHIKFLVTYDPFTNLQQDILVDKDLSSYD